MPYFTCMRKTAVSLVFVSCVLVQTTERKPTVEEPLDSLLQEFRSTMYRN